jgi:hypothetical protein
MPKDAAKTAMRMAARRRTVLRARTNRTACLYPTGGYGAIAEDYLSEANQDASGAQSACET